jgi:RNA processing factor Prp31
MTEELEKEAEDYADTKYIQGTTEWKKIKQTYIDSAEPREKRIAEKVKDKAEQFLKDCDIDNAIQQANKGLDFDKIADEMEQDLKDSEVEK